MPQAGAAAFNRQGRPPAGKALPVKAAVEAVRLLTTAKSSKVAAGLLVPALPAGFCRRGRTQRARALMHQFERMLRGRFARPWPAAPRRDGWDNGWILTGPTSRRPGNGRISGWEPISSRATGKKSGDIWSSMASPKLWAARRSEAGPDPYQAELPQGGLVETASGWVSPIFDSWLKSSDKDLSKEEFLPPRPNSFAGLRLAGPAAGP